MRLPETPLHTLVSFLTRGVQVSRALLQELLYTGYHGSSPVAGSSFRS